MRWIGLMESHKEKAAHGTKSSNDPNSSVNMFSGRGVMLRDNTERPETITIGANELIRTDQASCLPRSRD